MECVISELSIETLEMQEEKNTHNKSVNFNQNIDGFFECSTKKKQGKTNLFEIRITMANWLWIDLWVELIFALKSPHKMSCEGKWRFSVVHIGIIFGAALIVLLQNDNWNAK